MSAGINDVFLRIAELDSDKAQMTPKQAVDIIDRICRLV
jgi:hypothetical protein